MSNHINIRKAQASDQARIKQLIRQAHLNPFNNRWQNCWVAEDQQQIVGCIQLRPRPQQAPELASLVVAPSHQHQGLGSQLVQTIFAKHHGELYLMCVDQRVSFYLDHGFQTLPYNEWPKYFHKYDRLLKLLDAARKLIGLPSNGKLNIMRITLQ